MIRLHNARTAALLVAAAGLLLGGCKRRSAGLSASDRARADSVYDSLGRRQAPETRNGQEPIALEYEATDGAFHGGVRSIMNGPVALRFVNRGTQPHEIRLLRIEDPRVSIPQITGFIAAQGQLPTRDLTSRGGAGPIKAGHSITVTQFLLPGTYLIVNTVLDAEGRAWYTRGMIDSLVVTGKFALRSTATEVAKPIQPAPLSASATLMTTENVWRFGSSLTRGENTSLLVEGRNRRTLLVHGMNTLAIDHGTMGVHDLVIIRAREPRDMRRYVAWLNGDRSNPPDVVAGIPGVIPISKSFVTLDLAPGPYIIFCPVRKGRVPDVNYGFEVGEYDQFVVR